MRALISRQNLIRENFLLIIGIFLCVYFVYHTFHGERSLTRLLVLQQKIIEESEISNNVQNKRIELEKRVVSMRLNNLNKDVLEAEVRNKLGYIAPDEAIIISN